MGQQISPKMIILIGFLLVLAGAVIPFSMLIDLLPKTFFLSFVAYISSMVGLLMGTLGAGLYQKDGREDSY